MPWSDLSAPLAEDDELRGVYAYLAEVRAASSK
jgi:hypothetical protein